MQRCFSWPCRVKSTILTLTLFTLIIALFGCTKSVQKVSSFNNDAAALQSLSSRNDTNSIQNKSADDLITAGLIYLSNKNIKIAKMHFVTAINKDPKKAGAYIGLGRVEMFNGNYSGALASFAKASELDPESTQALIGESQALRAEGKLNDSIKTINKAIMIEPGDINVLKELAIVYDLMGKENLSAPLYHEIITMAPDQAANHNNMGLNYMVRGEYPKAILSFLQAHALNNDNLLIKNNLASAYLLSGDKENALEIFKDTVGEAGAYNNIGYLLMTQGHLDEAEQALRKALQSDPRHYIRAQENLDKLQRMRKTAKASEL